MEVGSGTEIGAVSEPMVHSNAQFSQLTGYEPVSIDNSKSGDMKNKLLTFPDATPLAILSRRRQITFPSVAAPVGANPSITPIKVWEEVKNNAPLRGTLDLFKGVRADIRISVVCRASAGQYGFYSVGYTYNNPTITRENLLSMDTMIGDVATSEGIEFVIPYRYPYDYLKTNVGAAATDNDYVILHIAYWGGASLDGGSASLDLDVYFALENVTATLYTQDAAAYPQSGPKTPNSFGFREAAHMGLNAAAAAQAVYELYNRPPQSDEPVAPHQSSGKPSSNSGKSKGVRQAFYGDLATLADEEQMPSLTETDTTNPIPDVSHAAMKPDITFKELGMIPGLLVFSQGSFLSTSAPGTFLHLQPCLGGEQSKDGSIYVPWSWASYFARFFRFYRGDHVIRMSFFTSPLISARFRVSIAYFNDLHDTFQAGTDDSMELPNEVFLVKGTTHKTFRIPYLSPYPMIRTGHTFFSINLTLISPPNTTSTVATKVFTLITHSIDNLEFASIQHGLAVTAAPPPLANAPGMLTGHTVQRAQRESGLREAHKSGEKSMCTGNTVSSRSHLGIVNSVVDLLRRFDTSLTEAGTGLYPVTGVNSLLTGVSHNYFNNVANIMQVHQVFAYISGTVENRIIYDKPAGPTAPRSASVSNTFNVTDTHIANGYSVTDIVSWPYLDYRTPYLSCLKYIPTLNTGTERSGASFLVGVNLETTDMTAVYVRAGPDFALYVPNVLPHWISLNSWANPPGFI